MVYCRSLRAVDPGVHVEMGVQTLQDFLLCSVRSGGSLSVCLSRPPCNHVILSSPSDVADPLQWVVDEPYETMYSYFEQHGWYIAYHNKEPGATSPKTYLVRAPLYASR